MENQKHPFSALPTPWKAKITQFLRFQPLGKSKTPIFCVSNPLENEKHPISAFPTPWKAKNTQFLHFQPLGKPKTPVLCASNPLESQNHPISAFPTPWKIKITQFPRFRHGGKSKTPKNSISARAENQKHPIRPHPLPRKYPVIVSAIRKLLLSLQQDTTTANLTLMYNGHQEKPRYIHQPTREETDPERPRHRHPRRTELGFIYRTHQSSLNKKETIHPIHKILKQN